MFKYLWFCTVTCLFALSWSKTIQLEDKPGYCTYESIYIKEGEKSPSPLGSCKEVQCNDAKTNAFSVLTCAYFRPKPGCSFGDRDYMKLYPDCCAKVVC